MSDEERREQETRDIEARLAQAEQQRIEAEAQAEATRKALRRKTNDEGATGTRTVIQFAKTAMYWCGIWFISEAAGTLFKAGYYHQLLGTTSLPFPEVTTLDAGICGVVLLLVMAFGAFLLARWTGKSKSQFVGFTNIIAALVFGFLAFYGAGRGYALARGSHAAVTVVRVRLDKDVDVAVFYRDINDNDMGMSLDPTTQRLGHELYSFPNRLTQMRNLKQIRFTTYATLRR